MKIWKSLPADIIINHTKFPDEAHYPTLGKLINPRDYKVKLTMANIDNLKSNAQIMVYPIDVYVEKGDLKQQCSETECYDYYDLKTTF